MATIEDLVHALSDETPSILMYDLQRLQRRIELLRNALPAFAHCFAIKAAPYRGLLRMLVDNGMGLEAASFPEVLLAKAVNAPVVLYDSPAKTRAEIGRALEMGLVISANSLDELARINPTPSGHRRGVGLRINPKVGPGHIAMTSVSTAGSRFGETYDALPDDLPVEGLHSHVGSQGHGIDQLCLGVRRLVETAQRYPHVTWLNIGGGLPAGQDFFNYAHALRETVPLLFSGRWRVYTEFGRALVACCGTALSRVEYVRDGVATIHLGADYMLRRVYRPQDWHYRFTILTPDGKEKQGPLRLQTIAGPLCFAGDILERAEFPEIAPGDIVAIGDVDAYTGSLWSRHCSRRMPPVFGVRAPVTGGQDGEVTIIHGGESDEDILRQWA